MMKMLFLPLVVRRKTLKINLGNLKEHAMDAWDYLVAVVREALQGLSRGMAGAVRAYSESAQLRPVAVNGHADLWTKGDLAPVPANGFWRDEEPGLNVASGRFGTTVDEADGRWTDPSYAYEPDNIYHGTLVDPTATNSLGAGHHGADW